MFQCDFGNTALPLTCGGRDTGKEKNDASLKHKLLFLKLSPVTTLVFQLKAGSKEPVKPEFSLNQNSGFMCLNRV